MHYEIGEIVVDRDTREKYITITISNGDIKRIKSSVEAYQGDKDDTKYQENMEKLRNNIHETWKKLNPS